MDKSVYSILNPTPKVLERAFCTDRPDKSTTPCTVDAGHFQFEADTFNATFARSGGVETNTYLIANPTLKAGLTNNTDLALNLAPLEAVDTRDQATGARTKTRGVGDLYIRTKTSLIGGDGGDMAIAISPFVKVPTAKRELGNGALEAGLIVPLSFNLPNNWSLILAPEAEALKNQDDSGRHLNLTGVVNISRPIDKGLTLSIELWSNADLDPLHTTQQYSLDAGAAWIPPNSPDFQIDAGINLGLTRDTPATQVYMGISQRF